MSRSAPCVRGEYGELGKSSRTGCAPTHAGQPEARIRDRSYGLSYVTSFVSPLSAMKIASSEAGWVALALSLTK